MMTKPIVAQRVAGQGSAVFVFSLPINLAIEFFEIPDPNHPFPDNRRVSKKHAMDFGNYWESHAGSWVVPPLLVDSSSVLNYRTLMGGDYETEVVEIELSPSEKRAFRILDGQHRILGWYLKKLELDTQLVTLTSDYNTSSIDGDKVAIERISSEIARTRFTLSRIENEHVVINLIDSVGIDRHKQFFVDIAKNALGINKTVQSKFDTSSVVNRVTKLIISEHPLFRDRIDFEKTTCSGTNPNLLTVVNVADITRHACFGIGARVTERRENTYGDQELESNISSFLDTMVANIPQLGMIVEGTLSPGEFREQYMLGSGTVWRCLAGTFYETCVVIDDELGIIRRDFMQVQKYELFLRNFSANMSLPISRSWFATKLFPDQRSKAPSSRSQDLRAMVKLMTSYVETGQLFVRNTPREHL